MSRRSPLDSLQAASPAILPSLLLCDFGNLEREVARLTAAGVPGLHLDVMDGVFVPNFTYGMTIEAGFGGQSFRPVALERLSRARQLAGDRLVLEVDGGVNKETISRCSAAGAQLFVVGSAIFKESDYGAAIRRLAELAQVP